MNLRRLLLLLALVLGSITAQNAAAAEDPTYITSLQNPQWFSTDALIKGGSPTHMHVMGGDYGAPVRGWWTFSLEPRSYGNATWAEVDGQMRICTEAGDSTPNIDVAFFLDTTPNLAVTNGENAFKSPAPGTCVDHGFNYPVQPAHRSLHISFELYRYEGRGPTVWVEWRNVVVKAFDHMDPAVRIRDASSLAVPANDLGRSSVAIAAEPIDLESGIRALEASVDQAQWHSVAANPTFALEGFGVHTVRLRAVDNAGRLGEPIAYTIRSFGRPVATTQPVTGGRARVGEILEAGPGTWDARGSAVDGLAYQWLKDGAPIVGATSATYTVGAMDVGTRLAARVSAHDERGWSEGVQSTATDLAEGAPVVAGRPAVSGNASVGTRLEAVNGLWAGTGALVFGYQWERCPRVGPACVSIPGAVGQAYVASSGDLGYALRVSVSGRNAWGADAALADRTSIVVQPAGPIAPQDETDRPVLQGAPILGSVMSTGVGSFSGTRPFSYTFQWLRCNSFGESCRPIPGATRQSFRPGPGDLGRTLRAVVGAANSSGSARSRTRPSSLVAKAGSATAGVAPASQVQVTLTTPFSPGKVGDGSIAWQLASSRLDLVARANRYRVRAGRPLVVTGRFSGDLGARPESVRVAAAPIVSGAGRYQRTVTAHVARNGRFKVRLVPLVNSTIVVDVPSSSMLQGATLAIGRVGVIPRIRVAVTASRSGGLLSAPRAVGRVLPRVPGIQLVWQARAGAVERLVCAPDEQPRSLRRGAIEARCSGVGIDPFVEFRLAFVPSGASAALFLAAASTWTHARAR